MNRAINWGIIGTGKIAQYFASAIRQSARSRLYSVLSRTDIAAARFAAANGAEQADSHIESFLADPNLDIVYVASPHPMHHGETLASLNAGKHVLCEKPIALNGGQLQEMIAAARSNRRFLMEAMWMWFIPAVRRAKELVDQGKFGRIHGLSADFGITPHYDPQARLFNPELGGGALLDIGIYPLALALFLFGPPEHIDGRAAIGPTGVDESFGAVLTYPDGKVATALASLRAKMPCEAVVSGALGNLRLHRNFWHSEHLTLEIGEKIREIHLPMKRGGLIYELEHVEDCIRNGWLESPVMSLDDSQNLTAMMDALRKSWGLVYPQEDSDSHP